MNDLLRAVRGSFRAGDPGVEGAPYTPGQRDIESGQSGSGADMAKFLAMVDHIKKLLNDFDNLCQELEQLEDKSKTYVKSREVQDVRNKMKAILDNMASILQKVKTSIELLEKDNMDAMHAPGRIPGSASERTRVQQTSGLAVTLQKKHTLFKGIKERIESDYLQVVKKRIEVVTGKDVTDEEAQNIIRDGQAESIIQKAIQSDAKNRIHLQNTLAEIQERNAAIHDIAQGTEEIVTLLADLSLIVHDQGQKLDDIQKLVGKAASFVDRGVVHVQEAREIQKEVQKKRTFFWLAIILAIIIGIAVIVAVVMRKRK